MRVISSDDAAGLVQSGQVVTVSGLMGNLVPERVLEALETRFLDSGEPHGLTEIHPWLYGGPDGTGLNRWAHPGFVRRIIGSTYILPSLSKTAQINALINDDLVEGHCWPANSIFQMLRAVGARRSGYLTTVGLGTFADPRVDGGRLNDSARDDLVEVVELGGDEHLFYRSIDVDCALIKASTADTDGNLFCENEGLTQGVLVQATAAHNSGGIVIAQVRRIVEAGSMHPLMVEVPGALVDYIVVDESAKQWEYGPNKGDHAATTGAFRTPLPEPDTVDDGAAKIIARRAFLELDAGDLVNIGGGIPITHLPAVAHEEGAYDSVRWSVEHGVFGGRVISATHLNPNAILSPAWLLDFYNGGGLDRSFLGMGEVDADGNVNVGRFGNQLPGPGGFTDIAASTHTMTFCGTMTSGGLEVAADDGRLRIVREGAKRKFVERCQMICFSGRDAVARGHRIMYITERAVFRLDAEGLVLTEVAPGIDVRREITPFVDFPIRVEEPLKIMDPRIFHRQPMRAHPADRPVEPASPSAPGTQPEQAVAS